MYFAKGKGLMKKTLFCILGILVVLIGAWIIGTGFQKEASAFVDDYSLNEDSSVMTLHTGVGSSMGFIRKVVVSQTTEGEIKLDFISAFGGLNGSIGAKSTYEISLDKNATSISIYQKDHYRLILKKDSDSGEWCPVDWIPRSAQ